MAKISVTQIAFPKDLPDDRCQLRLVIDVRLIDGKKIETKSFVLPGSEDDWNCKQGEKLRSEGADHAEVNLGQVTSWYKTALFSATSVDSLRVTLYDSQGDCFWGKIDKGFEIVLQLAEEEYLGEKLGAGSSSSKGKILFRHDVAAAPGSITLSGKGKIPKDGAYTVGLQLELD